MTDADLIDVLYQRYAWMSAGEVARAVGVDSDAVVEPLHALAAAGLIFERGTGESSPDCASCGDPFLWGYKGPVYG